MNTMCTWEGQIGNKLSILFALSIYRNSLLHINLSRRLLRQQLAPTLTSQNVYSFKTAAHQARDLS